MKKLEIFFKEKGLNFIQWELKDEKGENHIISNEVVIEQILNAPEREQQKIYKKLVKLDFKNADINNYLKHLAKKLIEI